MLWPGREPRHERSAVNVLAAQLSLCSQLSPDLPASLVLNATLHTQEALCRLGVVATQESPKTASHGGDDTCDEDFESASETDWDMRDEGPSVSDGPSGCRDQHGGSNESLPGSRSFPSLSSTANNGDKLPPASTSSPSEIVTKHATTGSSMFGKFFGYPSSDMASPKGDEQQPLGKVVSRFRGSWLSYLDFDGVR